jgi:hypothetical protein
MHLWTSERKKILGCIVSAKGIDPNPDKVQAILNIKVPKNIKDVQKLTGRLAALNRFILNQQSKVCQYFKHSKEPKGTSYGDLHNNLHLKR